MPNTSHAHSLSLSLLGCFGEKLNYNTLLFLTFISSSFLLFLEEKRKKKKKQAKQALRNLLLHSLHLVSQGRISNLDLRQKAGRWVVGAHLPP